MCVGGGTSMRGSACRYVLMREEIEMFNYMEQSKNLQNMNKHHIIFSSNYCLWFIA